jgi:squalene-hopene/tetraprenyl-beta-curcumene cyclase
MTYSGFKSYIYAELPRDDPRVQLARGWIGRNYTLAENPGLGTEGYYYYLVAFARALDAWGDPTIESIVGGEEVQHRWAEDLVATLAALQQPDGSFEIKDERWMENDPVLVTAYGVLALQAALDNN